MTILEVMDEQSHWFCEQHHGTDEQLLAEAPVKYKLRKFTLKRLEALQNQLPHAKICVENEVLPLSVLHLCFFSPVLLCSAA